MKITKAQLRKIIKETKALYEANPDGTISSAEGVEEQELLKYVDMQIVDLIDHINTESYNIGGRFRGPGIKSRVMRMLADRIHGAR